MPTPAAPPAKNYLQLLAAGLELVDAVKDLGTALRDQAKRALENGDIVPGYALSAGRAVRHWRDESRRRGDAASSSGSRAMTCSSKRCARPNKSRLRAKARGLKVPTEMIVSHPSGVSLVRSRKRTRSGARTERDRAVLLRGTYSLPRKRQSRSND